MSVFAPFSAIDPSLIAKPSRAKRSISMRLKFNVAKMVELARTANFRALDALAGQNAFVFDRLDCR
jgi:hypothetical protein